MTFLDYYKNILEDPTRSFYYTKTNNQSGSSGPLAVDKGLDCEIIWLNGRGFLLKTPIDKKLKALPPPPQGLKRDLSRDGFGYNVGILPDDPNGPTDKLLYKINDRNVSEGTKKMPYLERLTAVFANKKPTFKDILTDVKSIFPTIKMQFPKPPTFVWNPRTKDGFVDENAKLDPKQLKDKLKVKIPSIVWSARTSDGVDEAVLEFLDESYAVFEIGLNANHLTLTFYDATDVGSTTDDSEV